MRALLRELRALLEGAEERLVYRGEQPEARFTLAEGITWADRAVLLVRLDAAIRELEQRREP